MCAEADAAATHFFDEGVCILEVFGAVKYHVLEEVGEAALVVCFHEGAGIDVEAHGEAVGWFLVWEDDVAEAVWEVAEDGFWVCGDV